MLLFTTMVSHIIVLTLCDAAEILADSASSYHSPVGDVLGLKWRARSAAKEIARLAGSYSHHSILKITFNPCPKVLGRGN
ncbi:hypothetical protein GGR56DRAFT_662049 [Xylariaceae sp. FL0804]|nr:hypothetical protein GGR56DRAFT_662049 [Xylariaceae sp. FL0804]